MAMCACMVMCACGDDGTRLCMIVEHIWGEVLVDIRSCASTDPRIHACMRSLALQIHHCACLLVCRHRYLAALPNPQWINCDVRKFDMSVLGKFGVIMTDPPWEIHQDLPYGTMKDDEMLDLDIGSLQDDGVIFVWVTGE